MVKKTCTSTFWPFLNNRHFINLGWNQTGFVRNLFASKIYHSIDSQKQKKFKKFNNFQFKIGSIRKKKKIIWNICNQIQFSLCFPILNFDSQATLNWRYIINDHVHLYLICDRLTLINHTSSYSFPGFWISHRETGKMTHFLPRTVKIH